MDNISTNSSNTTKSISSREVTIRYNPRSSSVTSKPANKTTFVGVRYSTTADAESIMLEENNSPPPDGGDAGDAFDSAQEADEEEEHGTEQEDEKRSNTQSEGSSSNARFEGIFEDKGVEEVAMECRVVRQESSIVLDAPLPVIDTATFSTDQLDGHPHHFRLKFESFLARCCQLSRRHHTLPFFRFRVAAAVLLCAVTIAWPSYFVGFLAGVYISFLVFLFLFVSDPMPKVQFGSEFSQQILREVAEKQQQKGGQKIYKGWMNILNEHYHPHTFHVNTIQTVLVRLDGNFLRISRPERAMLKHAFHNDPTLREPEPRMSMQNIYDLTGAKVKLRPRRLARRRWFSRKYPICIKLAKLTSENTNENNCGLLRREPAQNGQPNEIGEGQQQQVEQSMQMKHNKNCNVLHEATSASEEEFCADDEAEPLRHSLSEYALSCGTKNAGNGIGQRRRKASANSSRNSGRYIFLFARSTREKERWFHKLRKACSEYKPGNTLVDNSSTEGPPKRHVSFGSLENLAEQMSKEYLLYTLQEFQFKKQLELLLGTINANADLAAAADEQTASHNGTVAMDLGLTKWTQPTECISDRFILLVNLIATRVFYDFCRDNYWCQAVRDKIQTKLATIHLPYFIETLELSTFDLGTSCPKIMKVYKPAVDEWGIWCDFEINYKGLIKLGLETKVNLMKLKSVSESNDESPSDEFGQLPFSTSVLRGTPSRYSDEEMPESPETSPDEEFGAKLKEFTSKRQKTGQKLLSFVDRVAHSKYFREAAELKPVKRMMEEISSTRLMLNVEVNELEGTMTCNFPPPPSDRLWYGFRKSPQMSMKAIPQVGERSVVYSALSEWIENKLQLILEKNLVLPNMDDVVIPIMSGNQLLQGNLNK